MGRVREFTDEERRIRQRDAQRRFQARVSARNGAYCDSCETFNGSMRAQGDRFFCRFCGAPKPAPEPKAEGDQVESTWLQQLRVARAVERRREIAGREASA